MTIDNPVSNADILELHSRDQVKITRLRKANKRCAAKYAKLSSRLTGIEADNRALKDLVKRLHRALNEPATTERAERDKEYQRNESLRKAERRSRGQF